MMVQKRQAERWSLGHRTRLEDVAAAGGWHKTFSPLVPVLSRPSAGKSQCRRSVQTGTRIGELSEMRCNLAKPEFCNGIKSCDEGPAIEQPHQINSTRHNNQGARPSGKEKKVHNEHNTWTSIEVWHTENILTPLTTPALSTRRSTFEEIGVPINNTETLSAQQGVSYRTLEEDLDEVAVGVVSAHRDVVLQYTYATLRGISSIWVL